MTINLEELFKDYGIDYRLDGPNVKQGNINVNCPFCSDDPSHHMGITLDHPHVYSCWRNKEHSGKNLAYLLSQLLQISYSQAKHLVGDRNLPNIDNVFEQVSDMFTEKDEEVFHLKMPKEFRSLFDGTHASKRFIHYLENRNFIEVEAMAEYYNLRYALEGKYADRVILPIYSNNKLVSWTGRTIHPNTSPKYKTATYNGEGKEAFNIKDFVFNPPELRTDIDNVLFVTEGPFDALKMDWFSILSANGCRATSIFGVNYGDEQLAWLTQYSKMFRRIVVAFDPDSAGQTATQRLLGDLYTYCPVSVYKLDCGDKDMGDLTWTEFKSFFGDFGK